MSAPSSARPWPPLLRLALLGSSLAWLAGGCAARRPPAEELLAPARFAVELRLEAHATWRRVPARELRPGAPTAPVPALAPAPDPAPAPADAVDQALAPLRASGLQARLLVELSLARRFRDGSLGWLVRIVDATGSGLVEDAAGALVPGPAMTGWTLAGRSVELRTFPDGEILSVDEGLHVLGPDRLGGVVDLLWPLLSPFPPELEAGAQARRISRWPMIIDAQRGWRHSLGATWSNLGRDEARQAWHLRWEGPMEARGRDAAISPPVGVLGQGDGQGELYLDDRAALPMPLRVVAHTLAVRRRVEVEYPAAPGGPLRVSQDQVVNASLQRVGAAGGAPP